MDRLGKRLARGDQAAFAELFDLCADRLRHYLAVRLRSWEDADEVLQETFVRLARRRRKLAAVDNVAAYAFTIARNEASRLLKRKSRERANRTDGSGDVLTLEAAADDRQARELADLIAAGLDRLAPQQREIVELRAYAGLTFREIAEVAALPQGTVATRYRTAIGRLREWFTKELS